MQLSQLSLLYDESTMHYMHYLFVLAGLPTTETIALSVVLVILTEALSIFKQCKLYSHVSMLP